MSVLKAETFTLFFHNKKNQQLAIWSVFALKILVSVLFSSDYSNALFLPFIREFIHGEFNPWEHFYGLDPNKFPYPPLMLIIFTPFVWISDFISSTSSPLALFFFKVPILIADAFLFIYLVKLFKGKFSEIFLFYYCSPIVIYASLMHSQIDLIPTVLFVVSVYYLIHKRLLLSALLYGFSLSTKIHVLAALPLLLIFIYKKEHFFEAFKYGLIAVSILVISSAPWFSEGFINSVFLNPEQRQVADLSLSIGSVSIYIIPILLLGFIFQFAQYTKINNDLLFGYLGIVFSSFVLLTSPSPGWYIWFYPFVVTFTIKKSIGRNASIWYFVPLSVLYLIYFVGFYDKGGLINLYFLNGKVGLTYFSNPELSTYLYTLLWANLAVIVYVNYRFGIRSNSVYKNQNRPYIIGISGNSGSGKSTLLHDIKLLWNHKILEIEGDGDHKWERGDENWETMTHLNPKANLLYQQAKDLFDLKMGYQALRRDYDHSTGKFTSKKRLNPKEIITICGLHSFYLPKMRSLVDLKVYIDTDENLRRHWKVLRDQDERGHGKEAILKSMDNRSEDAARFVLPQKDHADLIVRYYTDDVFEIGDPNFHPEILLSLKVSANINIIDFINLCLDIGVQLDWEYDDLSYQVINIKSIDNINKDGSFIESYFNNVEEIINEQVQWQSGHRYLTQLLVLTIITEFKKEESADEVI